MENNDCAICGLSINSKFPHTLKCNHTFHYECLFKSFKSIKNTNCPYCRSTHNLLPVVNGLKKIDNSIHEFCNNDNSEYENKMCDAIIKKGPNKGKQCGNNCKLGYFKCQRHIKS